LPQGATTEAAVAVRPLVKFVIESFKKQIIEIAFHALLRELSA
jgi:hypothetical protein